MDGTRFDIEINYDTYMKYVDTQDEKYLHEFMNSEDGTALCVHVLRYTQSKYPFMRKQNGADSQAISQFAVDNTEHLGTMYMIIYDLLKKYKSGKAQPNTFIYNYAPLYLLRVYNGEDVNKDYSLDYEYSYGNDTGTLMDTMVEPTSSHIQDDVYRFIQYVEEMSDFRGKAVLNQILNGDLITDNHEVKYSASTKWVRDFQENLRTEYSEEYKQLLREIHEHERKVQQTREVY